MRRPARPNTGRPSPERGAVERRVGFAIVIAAVTMAPTVVADPVGASIRASVHRTVVTTTSGWGAVAVERDGPVTTHPLTLSWRVNRGTAYQYIDIVNIGDVALTGQSYEVTNTNDKDNRTKAPTVVFEACLDGSWSPASHTCSGRVSLMGSTDAGSFATANTPISPGARLEVRASTSPSSTSSYVTTMTVVVTRSQTRTGVPPGP